MRNRFCVILLFIILSSGNLSALTVTVDFGDPAANAALAPLIPVIINDVTAKIGKYGEMPEFARGFGNANTYASHAATLRGYQGYDIFAIAVGSMVSLQAPSEDPKFFTKLQDDLDKGDVYAGVGMNPLVVQAGLNLSFLIEDLYLSFKFGKFNYKIDKSKYKIDYNSNLFGLLLNYQIFREKSILARSILWRGISLESGCIYSNNIVKYFKEIDPIKGIAGGGFTADADPSVEIELDTKSYIVPVELYSSIRLMYILNIGVGGGIDYVAGGKTDIKLLSGGDVTIVSGPLPALVGQKGQINIDASTKGVKADKYRTKLMANLGLSLGPVFIDMPATYYLTDNGYSVGLSAGMAW